MTAAEHSSTQLEGRDVRPVSVEVQPLEASATGARLVGIDYAKAIGIILVVFGHVWRGLVAAGIVRDYGWIDRWIYAFHMPVFFFIAGLFIERAVARPLASVLVSKAATLLYPYLIWSVVQAVFGAIFAGYTNRQFALADLPRVLLIHPYSPFWFLYVLFMTEMVFVVARKIAISHTVLLAIGLALLWWADGFRWVPGMYFGNMFVYLVAGAMLSRAVHRLTADSAMLWYGIAAGVALTALALWADVHQPLLEFVAAACGIVMVLGVATALSKVSWATALSGLGVLSLQVFLMHVLFASGVRVILHRFAHVDNQWIHLAAGVVFGVAGPLLFWAVMRPMGGEWLFRLPTRSFFMKRSVVA
jgi:fucose 4-O-acetylase-like acetyltransferase